MTNITARQADPGIRAAHVSHLAIVGRRGVVSELSGPGQAKLADRIGSASSRSSKARPSPVAAGFQKQALIGGERVPRPLPEPWVPGDHPRPVGDHLVGRDGEVLIGLVKRLAMLRHHAGPVSRRGHQPAAGRRGWAGRPRPRLHSQRLAGGQLGGEGPRVPQVLGIGQAARGFLPVADPRYQVSRR
jgi:hypothetical protein